MEEKSSKLSIATKIITAAFALALVSFVVFFSIHLYRSTVYDMFDGIIPSDSFKAAYSQNSDLRTHDVGTEGLSANGVIKVTNLVYIEEINEDGTKNGEAYMQFGVRINKLHIDEVVEVCPGVTYDDISFYLVATSQGETIYNQELSLIDEGEKFQYKFYKFENNDVIIDCDSLKIEMRIDGITVAKDENQNSILVEKEGEVHVADYEEMHNRSRTSIEYKLSRKEKKLIG